MKTALVIPARGIGDALLMMGASHALLRQGYQVTTFHTLLTQLQNWFPEHLFISTLPPTLSNFDLIVIENDNSPRMHAFKSKYPRTKILYPSYHPAKNPPFTQEDYLFNPKLTMAENSVNAFNAPLENGITPLPYLTHRKYPQRILIHPTSSSAEKNWCKKSYLKLFSQLKKQGWDVQFVMSEEEKEMWQEDAITFGNLADLASHVFESGGIIGNDSLLGHLASNLKIPQVVIANDGKRMELWRPGWLKGEVVTPPTWIPNFKFCRLRDKKWQTWITVKTVLKAFEKSLSLMD